MKPQLDFLRKGQEVWAIVEEPLAGRQLIANFAGDLLKIKNETKRTFRAGERICLRVEAINPLRFKLISPAAGRARRRHSLDLSV